MLFTGFHHVALKATDFARSYAFYTEGLGMEPRIAWGEGDNRAVMLDLGGDNCIELFAGGKKQEPGSWFHVAIQTTDCDEAFRKALAAGASEKEAPHSLTIDGRPAPMDIRISFVYGPDGEVIEFFQVL